MAADTDALPAGRTHVSAKAPPIITILGSSDWLVSPDHAELLDQALSNTGVSHEMYFLPSNDHGFDVNWSDFGKQIARTRIKNFPQRN